MAAGVRAAGAPRAGPAPAGGAGVRCRAEPGRRSVDGALRLASYANRKQKYVVSAMVAGVLVARRFDAESCVCVCGAIANAAVCRVLKAVIRQERPVRPPAGDRPPPNGGDGDGVRDGMPSSHAASLIFLSVYLAAAIVAAAPAWRAAAAAGVLLAGCFLSYLRVLAHRHTPAQVLVGALLGGVSAILCRLLLHQFPPSARAGGGALSLATAAMSIAFGASVRGRWMRGEPA